MLCLTLHLPQQLFQLLDHMRVVCVLGEIFELALVILVIVKFDSCFALIPFSVAPSFCSDTVAHNLALPDLHQFWLLSRR